MDTNAERPLRIVACICICEEDRKYLYGLFEELLRMDVDVSWLCNNCSDEMVAEIRSFERTVSVVEYNGDFHNCLRNLPLEKVQNDYDFFIQWDADEIWEPAAPRKLREFLTTDEPFYQVRMAHVWEGDMVTTDWAAERDRIYNLKYRWLYLSRVVAGPTAIDSDDTEVFSVPIDLWMVHYGYSTPQERERHKKRWDRLHGKSAGKNPYGMWDTITKKGYTPRLVHIIDLFPPK